VPGEKEFKHKGVTYCATCDGPLFSGKDVAVIGGSNSALDAALQMIRIASHVYVINPGSALGGDVIMREKVEKNRLVTVLNGSKITAIVGEKMVTGIKIMRDNKEETIPVEGLFVEVGLIPNSKFAVDLDKNKYGEIKINMQNETNVPGIFAAGDVTDVPQKQIIIAAGEGSKAALSAFKYLNQLK
jgi:alkyl hydroperoxide reductase subunit AhpF